MLNYNYFSIDGYVNYGKLVLKTAPTDTAISLAEAKQHLRVDSDYDDDNDYITALIGVATNQVEEFTRRRLMTQTYNLFFDVFPPYIDLQVGIIQSVTHVKYYDNNNVLQTLASSNYDLDDKIKPGNAVEIEFIVGRTANEVEDAIKQAMLIIVGRYYEQRQDIVLGTQVQEIPLMVEYMLTPYRFLEL